MLCWIVSIQSSRAAELFERPSSRFATISREQYQSIPKDQSWRIKYYMKCLGWNLAPQKAGEEKAAEQDKSIILLPNNTTKPVSLLSQLLQDQNAFQPAEEAKILDPHEEYLQSLTFNALMMFCDPAVAQMHAIDSWDHATKKSLIELYKQVYRKMLDQDMLSKKERDAEIVVGRSMPIAIGRQKSGLAPDQRHSYQSSCAVSLRNSLHQGTFGFSVDIIDEDPDHVFKKVLEVALEKF